MIALDTNLLVYAHREDSVWHDAAYTRVTELAEGRALYNCIFGNSWDTILVFYSLQ
jgi:predicted nucleic acid-binding protein